MICGFFEYKQFQIQQIIESLEDIVEGHTKSSQFIHGQWVDNLPEIDGYSKDTKDEFLKGLELLEKAQIYAQRIDWLLSGDDGEESFHRRLRQDLEELNAEEQS